MDHLFRHSDTPTVHGCNVRFNIDTQKVGLNFAGWGDASVCLMILPFDKEVSVYSVGPPASGQRPKRSQNCRGHFIFDALIEKN
jgi:hypothetical protein